MFTEKIPLLRGEHGTYDLFDMHCDLWYALSDSSDSNADKVPMSQVRCKDTVHLYLFNFSIMQARSLSTIGGENTKATVRRLFLYMIKNPLRWKRGKIAFSSLQFKEVLKGM